MTDAQGTDEQARGHAWDRALQAAVIALAAGLLVITVARVTRAWPLEAHLGYAEGIWLGLATDAAQGVFYRPLDGPLGYGGTRYFPLFYLANAALIRTGLNPVAAGYALAGVSVALLVAGMFVWLRRVGASVPLALAASAVALSLQPTQMAALAMRGDALAAALVMWGLAACLPGGRLRAAPWLFALAFAAKPTSVYGVMAAVVWLASSGRRADARRLVWQTAAGMLAVVALIVAATGGRAIEVFTASVAGGAGLASALLAPMSLVRILRRVPESTFFIQLAGVSILASLRWTRSLERVAFLVCLATTTAIYASPATVENHLIDVSAIAVVVLAALAARDTRWTRPVLALLLVGGMASGATAAWRFRSDDAVDLRSGRRAVVASLAGTTGPILFEQPLLAVERGDSPYFLDLYIFSVRVANDPSAVSRLIADLDQRHFGAIVIEAATPDLAFADTLTGDAAARFRSALDRHYRLDAIVGGRSIYRPK